MDFIKLIKKVEEEANKHSKHLMEWNKKPFKFNDNYKIETLIDYLLPKEKERMIELAQDYLEVIYLAKKKQISFETESVFELGPDDEEYDFRIILKDNLEGKVNYFLPTESDICYFDKDYNKKNLKGKYSQLNSTFIISKGKEQQKRVFQQPWPIELHEWSRALKKYPDGMTSKKDEIRFYFKEQIDKKILQEFKNHLIHEYVQFAEIPALRIFRKIFERPSNEYFNHLKKEQLIIQDEKFSKVTF